MPQLPMVLIVAAAISGSTAVHALAPAPPPEREWRTTTVDLPDGSKAEIKYVGDVPPRVNVSVPGAQEPRSALVDDVAPADDEAETVPRARRVVQTRLAPTPAALPAAAILAPQLIIPADAPRGSTWHYTLITTGADGRVCSQRTEWTVRGRNQAPAVRRSDSGDGCAGLSPPTPSRQVMPLR